MSLLSKVRPAIQLSYRSLKTTRSRRGGHDDGYWGYREPNYAKPKDFALDQYLSKFFGGLFAFETLYLLFHETGMLVGEFPYYNHRTDFTDEELGIPPDSEGLAPMIENPRSVVIPTNSHGRHNHLGPQLLEKVFGDIGEYKF